MLKLARKSSDDCLNATVTHCSVVLRSHPRKYLYWRIRASGHVYINTQSGYPLRPPIPQRTCVERCASVTSLRGMLLAVRVVGGELQSVSPFLPVARKRCSQQSKATAGCASEPMRHPRAHLDKHIQINESTLSHLIRNRFELYLISICRSSLFICLSSL